jgi:hypothetical protein
VGLGCAVITRRAFAFADGHTITSNGERMYFAEFDRNGRWYPEDAAFCDRVLSGGGSVVVDTSVVVGHLPRRPQPNFPPQGAVQMKALPL